MSDYKYSNKIFIERASELIFNSGETQAELVEHLGLSNGSVANLKNKKGQTPSAETVCALANYFNVSTDWLLGLTDVQTTDKATKELCDTLGLNENALMLLGEMKDTFTRTTFNWLAEQHIGDKVEALRIKMLDELKAYNKAPTIDFSRNWSIIWNIAKMVEISNANSSDIQFTIDQNGNFNAIFSKKNEEVNKIQKEQCFGSEEKTFPCNFGLCETLAQQYAHNAYTQLSRYADKISRFKKSQYIFRTVKELMKMSEEEQQEYFNDF